MPENSDAADQQNNTSSPESNVPHRLSITDLPFQCRGGVRPYGFHAEHVRESITRGSSIAILNLSWFKPEFFDQYSQYPLEHTRRRRGNLHHHCYRAMSLSACWSGARSSLRMMRSTGGKQDTLMTGTRWVAYETWVNQRSSSEKDQNETQSMVDNTRETRVDGRLRYGESWLAINAQRD